MKCVPFFKELLENQMQERQNITLEIKTERYLAVWWEWEVREWVSPILIIAKSQGSKTHELGHSKIRRLPK